MNIVAHSRYKNTIYLDFYELFFILLTVHKINFQDALNEAVKKDIKNNSENIQDFVLAVEIVECQTVFGYTGEKKSLFLKITVALPKLIAPCKRLLETQVVFPSLDHKYSAYESNIDFDIRFVKNIFYKLIHCLLFKKTILFSDLWPILTC